MGRWDGRNLLGRATEFVVGHRLWTVPLIWLVITAIGLLVSSSGYDRDALPWVAGVLAVWVAGALSGVVCIVKSRSIGWLGLLGLMLFPVFHLGWKFFSREGWASTFVVDVVAIAIASLAAAATLIAAWMPALPGSLWEKFDQRRPSQRRRRRPVKPFGSLLLSCLVSLAGFSCVGSDGTTGTTTTSTTTATTTTTTQSTATTGTTQPSHSTVSTVPTATSHDTTAPPDLPALLVADAEGVRLIDGSEVTTFLVGSPADSAFPDLAGGVIYIGPHAGSWHWDWDEEGSRAVLAIDEPGGGPSPIWRIRTPGSEPEMLVEPTGFLWLEQVVELNGHPTLIFRVQVPEVVACTGSEDCVWQSVVDHLIALDLVTSDRIDLGIIGSFESSGVGIRFSEHLLVVTTSEYGTDDVCGAVLPRDDLALRDPPTWIGAGGPLWRTCEFGPKVECLDEDPSVCGGTFAAAIAPDGETVAYAQALQVWNTGREKPAELVVIDAVSGTELRRVEIGSARVATSWIDWDGRYAIVGRYDTRVLGAVEDMLIAPVIVLPDDTVVELAPNGRYALWSETAG